MPDLSTRPARIVTPDEALELAILSNEVFTLPRPIEAVGAILVLPGQGEYGRVVTAVDEWEANPGVRYLLVAGHTKTEPQFEEFTPDRLEDFGLTRHEGVVIQPEAFNTPAQADWMTARVQSLGITSLAVVAPHYHLLRGYLTMLQGFIRHGLDPIPMIPWPVPAGPATVSPKNGVSYRSLLPGELSRIVEYQESGDVATLETTQAYMGSIWETWPPLRDAVPSNSPN